MDPLTSLGLAANIVQFVDFTSKLFVATQRLYASQSGAKTEHLELESLAQNIKELAERAKPRNVPNMQNASAHDKTLIALGNQCIEVSDELLSVLESLKVKGDNGKRSWDSFHQALRSEWKKGDIELLQRRLDRISTQLNTRVLLDQQAKVVSQLHQLAGENRRLDASRTQELDRLREDIQNLFKEMQSDMTDENSKRRALAQISDAAAKGVEYSSEMSMLEFLRFDTIDYRQFGIRKAHENTFSWIFGNSTLPSEEQSSCNFGDWLRSDHSLFWVTGKPGSGKSTLMNFICELENLENILETWAEGYHLFIAKFFFWNAGHQSLQKSQEGLLRSILYQILRQSPDLIPYAEPELWKSLLSGVSRDPSAKYLTIAHLLNTFRGISSHLAMAKARFCFFIDGLDEYEGRPDDIIQLIELLKSTLQVKMCISSRPWNEFEKAFGQDQSKKLYMQELTKNDIRTYVRDILEKDVGFQELEQRDDRSRELVQDIVDAAQGVFLWVFLVVRSLLEGLTNADRIVDLQRRLRLLPTDLNEYFERILFTVDNFYRKETAQMFLVTLMSIETLSLITYWFMDQDATFLENLQVEPVRQRVNYARLARMQKRLNACCKGLLEVQLVIASYDLVFEPERDFFYRKVDFLHRTVRDFLRESSMLLMLERWAGKEFNADVAISQALLAQFKTAPQTENCFISGGPMETIVQMIFQFAERLEVNQDLLLTEVRLLDELQMVIAKHNTKVKDVIFLLSKALVRQHNHSAHDCRKLEYLVLQEAVQRGLQHYVAKKLDEQPSLPPSVQSDLLYYALVPQVLFSIPSSRRLEMAALFLKKGFDPNAACGNATVLTSFLEEMTDLHWAYDDDLFHIIKYLLEHGADVNAICYLRRERDDVREQFKAAEAIRMIFSDHQVQELGDLLPQKSNYIAKQKVVVTGSKWQKRISRIIFRDRKEKGPS